MLGIGKPNPIVIRGRKQDTFRRFVDPLNLRKDHQQKLATRAVRTGRHSDRGLTKPKKSIGHILKQFYSSIGYQ